MRRIVDTQPSEGASERTIPFGKRESENCMGGVVRREKRRVKELRPGAVLTRCLPARIQRIAMERRYITVSQAGQMEAKRF